MAVKTRPEKGNAIYSPTQVTRYVIENSDWVELETFTDATVQDNGDGGMIRAPQAMLRAYSNDPNFFGDEDYQARNGIHVQTESEAKRFGEYYDSKPQQYVMDCDGDIALKRIRATVVSKYDFGHGSQEWTVIVSQNDDGWGYKNLRYEKWRVTLRNS